MKPILIFDCGCKLDISQTEIKTYNKGGNKYTCQRLCKKHGGRLLHKIVTCDVCSTKTEVNGKCNRKKCKCGALITISNGEKPVKKTRRSKQKVKDCIFCGKTTNAGNKDNLCTKCHNSQDIDSMNLVAFESFARNVAEAKI
jgi:hypothetical protein